MNILFLDIDGVMKPGRCYWSKERSKKPGFDPLAVDCVNRICERTNSKIVFNTVWNKHPNLLEQVIEAGIKEEYIHKEYKTIYGTDTYNRVEAIQSWLYYLDEDAIVNWCVLDDTPLYHRNAILVNYNNGISVENYRKATKLLGNEDKFMVLL